MSEACCILVQVDIELDQGLAETNAETLSLFPQDIEHFKALAEANAEQTREEALCFMGEHTQALILEVCALRCKIDQLKESMNEQLTKCRNQAIVEYKALVDQLFSASLSIKNRFEEYRCVASAVGSGESERWEATPSVLGCWVEWKGVVFVRQVESISFWMQYAGR